MENKKELSIGLILFAILYLIVGLSYLIWGAEPNSRLYQFDDFLIRLIGLIFIVSCIGLFLKKEIARKGMVLALSMSIIEIFVGAPKEINILEYTIFVIEMLITYVPGLIYFIVIGNEEYLMKLKYLASKVYSPIVQRILRFIYLVAGLFTPVALWFYFSPWIYNFPFYEVENLHIFSTIWFYIAWLFAVGNIDSALKLKRNQRISWILYIVVAFIISACYEGLIIGWLNGYMLVE